MAKTKETKEPPAYIDYTGDSSAISSTEYTGTHFADYWRKQLVRKHRMAALPLTIKDKSLWKRLAMQYEPDDLIAMIDRWMDNPRAQWASFPHFYIRIDLLYKEITEKDYEWD